jgi:hypothetical protein
MNIREIIEAYLLEYGYDGLLNTDIPCGCFRADLMPCDEPGRECEAGYEGPCVPEDCENGGCDKHMYKTRKAVEAAKARLAKEGTCPSNLTD